MRQKTVAHRAPRLVFLRLGVCSLPPTYSPGRHFGYNAKGYNSTMWWIAGLLVIGCVNIESGKMSDTGVVRTVEEESSRFVNDCTEGLNDQPEQASVLVSDQNDITLCEQDNDFYLVEIPPGEWLSLTMRIDGSGHNGIDNSDLDLWEINRPTAPIDPELDRYSADLDAHDIIWSSVAHNSLERLAWFNPTDVVQQRWVLVNGFDGATGQYALSTTTSMWTPSVPCASGCNDLMLFPQAYDVSNGYVVTHWTQYSHVRRAVAYSIQQATAAVREQMPAAAPLGLGDMSQYDTQTPGQMEDLLRHPPGSHTHGNHVEVAYYQNSNNNLGREVCENDGSFCTARPELLDAESTALFVNELLDDPTVSQIVMDTMIRDAVISAGNALGLEIGSQMSNVIEAGPEWPRRYVFMDIEYMFEESVPIENRP